MTMDKPFGSLDGAPIVTKFAITETEKLAEIIERYKLNNRPVPEYCIEGIKQLASLLQQSQPDYNLELSLKPGLDPEEIVNNNLEIAWYLSAWLYFYNRLAKFSDEDALFLIDVPFFVDEILIYLLRAESVKSMTKPNMLRRRDPVTFPAFVASCNASKRDP